MINLFYVLIIGLTLYLGSLPLLQKQSAQENRYYSAICLSIAFWIFIELLARLHPGLSYLPHITFSMGVVIPHLSLLLVMSIISPLLLSRRAVRVLLAAPSTLVFIYTMSPFFAKKTNLGLVFDKSSYVFYLGYVGIYILLIFGTLIHGLVIAPTPKKKQLFCLLFGGLIFASGSITTNVILPMVFNYYSSIQIGPLFSIAFVFFSAISLLKTKLNRPTALVMTALLFLFTFKSLMVFFELTYPALLSSSIWWVIASGYGVLAGLLFLPFYQKLLRSTTWISLPSPALLLTRITPILSESKTIGELVAQAGALLREAIDPVSLKFYFPENLNSPEVLVLYDARTGQIVTPPQFFLPPCQYKNEHAEICIPCFSGDRLFGYMVLGSKATQTAYTDDDKQFIKALSSQLTKNIAHMYLHERYLKSVALAEQANQQETFSTLARGIAHEIKNPLTMILSAAELLSHHRENPEEIDRFSDMIRRNIMRLVNVTETMLKYGAAVSKEKQRVFLPDLLKDLLLLIEVDCKQRHVVLEQNIMAPFWIYADPSRLHQAILNLLVNALQALDGRNGFLRLTTTETTREGKPFVDMVIEDSGIGIPEEKLPHIFDAFYTTKPGNSGLGLSLCAKIFAENDCIVDVHSESGKGTTFTLSFPILVQ